ncbi:MAG TPA: alpha/beta hydrolase domain-containing protein, partial [Gammaproteobacteria bacterium]|nr:alpha/beta hydrolase domain-containing protein [Gammaproteobacteria bacterium]
MSHPIVVRRSLLPVLAGAAVLAAAGTPAAARAELVRIEVAQDGALLDGASFGETGSYEKLAGRLYFAVDPQAAANRSIADIAYAPTTAEGRVEFQADFYLLRPKDAKKANGTLLFEVANRGGKGLFSMFDHGTNAADPAAAADVGDGFLLEQGYTLLWVGWQFDVPEGDGRVRVDVPAATDHGRPIEGLVRSDFVVSAPAHDHSLGDRGHLAYPSADLADREATMTVRDEAMSPRRAIPREHWRFARVDRGRVVEDPRSVYLEEGFEPFKIYEVVYRSRNPAVAGLGLAAIRDAVSALEHEGADELGLPRGTLGRSIAFGLSQSGRLLRTFLYDGFNEDEQGRKVFDGVMAHLAGGARGSFNVRFAQPSRASWSYFYPLEIFPFTDEVQTDPETSVSDGLLARVPEELRPKIFYTNSSNEYW